MALWRKLRDIAKLHFSQFMNMHASFKFMFLLLLSIPELTAFPCAFKASGCCQLGKSLTPFFGIVSARLSSTTR